MLFDIRVNNVDCTMLLIMRLLYGISVFVHDTNTSSVTVSTVLNISTVKTYRLEQQVENSNKWKIEETMMVWELLPVLEIMKQGCSDK